MQCASRPLCAAAIWACFVLWNEHARAEDKPGSGTPPPCSEAAAGAAYRDAKAKYAHNDVPGALDSMRESYALCPRPELLYNLAVLERELGQCRAAFADIASYLEQVPHGRYREAAEKARAELTRDCPAPPPPAPPPTAAYPPPPPPPLPPAPLPPTKAAVAPSVAATESPVNRAPSSYWTPPRVVGWSAIGAGVLAGGGALYFQLAATSARNDYQRNVDAAYAGTATLDPNLANTQRRDQRLAQLLAVSGGALVTGGALLLIFGSKDETRAATSVQVQAQPDLLRACYTQRF